MSDKNNQPGNWLNDQGKHPNGFTTERELDGERRSIRHWNDGHTSHREAANYEPYVPGKIPSLNSLLPQNVKTRKASVASTASSQKPAPKTSASSSRTSNAFQMDELHAAIDEASRSGTSGKRRLRNYKPTEFESEHSSTSSRSVSPFPPDSPELMNTEFVPAPVAPRTKTANPNSISSQWRARGGNKTYEDIGYYD